MPTTHAHEDQAAGFAAASVALSAMAMAGVLLTRWPEATEPGDATTLAYGRWLLGSWADPIPPALPVLMIALPFAAAAMALLLASSGRGHGIPSALAGCVGHGPLDLIGAGTFVALTGLVLTFKGMDAGIEEGLWALHEIGNTVAAAGVLVVLSGFLVGSLGPRHATRPDGQAHRMSGTSPGR